MNYNMTTLGELSIDGGSYGIAASAVPYSKDLPTYLRITDINDDGTINFAGLKSVSASKSINYYLKPNDIVFARTGASTGRNYFYDGKDGNFVYAGFLIKFSIDPLKINPKYLKYYCLSKNYNNWILSFNSGSTRGNINAQTLSSMPVPMLPRPQQDLLVNTLSVLDEKIELNNRINKNLEAQVQAIFKSWFVDFEPFKNEEFINSELGVIPKGWKVGILSEISDIVMGQSPSGSSYNENGEGMVFYQGRAEFGNRFPKRRLFTTEPKREAQEKDILLSVRAPVGDFNIATEKCCIGRGLASIAPKPSFYSYCVCLMGHLKPYFDTYNGEGTVFGSINKASLNNMKVIIPTIDVVKKFDVLICDMNKIILSHFKQNEALSTLRDTLLPKLMSGEIQIPQEV